VLVAVAFLYPAFKLHDRAGELESRERSLKQRMEIVSRRERSNDDRERDLKALAVRHGTGSQATEQTPPRELPVLVDEGVRQAGYQRFGSPVNLSPATD